jgi:hypothetical protein
MDGEKFDDLIRKLCTTRLTRLGALRGLAVGAAAVLTGATLASDETDAKSKKKKKGGAKKGGAKKGAQKGGQSGGPSLRVAVVGTDVEYTGQGRGCNPDAEACVCDAPDSDTVCCTTAKCDGEDEGTMQFNVLQVGDGTTAVSITVLGTTYPCEQQGQSSTWLCDVPLVDLNSLCDGDTCGQANCPDVFATYNGTPTDAAKVVLSHACGCVPETCPADEVVEPGDTCTFPNGCGGNYECPCDNSCGDENSDTNGNYTCVKDDDGIGTCSCDPEECDAGVEIAPGGQCRFDDGCCSTYECPCETDCGDDDPDTRGRFTCDAAGFCSCTPRTCPTRGFEGQPCGSFNNGCCGTYECTCSQTCPRDAEPAPDVTTYTNGNNCTSTTQGACDCIPTSKEVACAGKCGGVVVDDGCCGTYTCDDCCFSCTQGYYKENQCLVDDDHWPVAPDTAFPCATTQPGSPQTYAAALECKGGANKNPTCNILQAQQAAAILNLLQFECYDATNSDDPLRAQVGAICAETNPNVLASANEHDKACCSTGTCANPAVDCPGRTCPLRGCGNS